MLQHQKIELFHPAAIYPARGCTPFQVGNLTEVLVLTCYFSKSLPYLDTCNHQGMPAVVRRTVNSKLLGSSARFSHMLPVVDSSVCSAVHNNTCLINELICCRLDTSALREKKLVNQTTESGSFCKTRWLATAIYLIEIPKISPWIPSPLSSVHRVA